MHVKIATILIGIIAVAKVSSIVWGVKSLENLLDTEAVFGMPIILIFILAASGLLIYEHYKKRR